MSDINLALTTAGQALKAKIDAGNGLVPLHITRIVAASVGSADPLNQTDDTGAEQEFTITGRSSAGERAAISAVLTNQGNPAKGIAPLATGYQLKQIRFYAIDPDDGEILYRISQFDDPNYVPAAKERGWTYEPTYNFTSGNASEVTIASDPKGLVTFTTLEDRLAALDINPDQPVYPLTDITHNLDTYPDPHIIEFSDAYGIGGYADGPYGGSNGRKLRYAVEYLDRNRLRILVEKQYYPVKEVTQVNAKAYTVSFTGGTLILLVQLITNDMGGLAGVASFNGRTGKVTLEEPDIPEEIARTQDITSTVGSEVSNQLAQIPSFDGGEII